jgi:methylmalonyl-CoA mutase
VQAAFDKIDLETLPILAYTGAAALPFIALLGAHHQQHGGSLKKLHGCIGMDPLGILACEGTLPYSLSTAYNFLATATKWSQQQAPCLKTLLIEGMPYHESGGSAVQELAFVLATAVEYLRELTARGLSVDAVASRMQFTFAIGPECFLEIAKLRAARVLWAKVVKACGGNAEAQKMHAHIRTPLRGKTLRDPYVNMLRTTVEAFAGVVGGCESMHVGSFDDVFWELNPSHMSDEFSDRIARNTQSILKDESHLHEVIDPVGGSWYVEHLTDEVARKAWKLFQEIEQQGGMPKALEAGYPQEKVAETASQRRLNLATRKDVLVGTNMYANLEDVSLTATASKSDAIYQTRLETVQQFKANRQWTGVASAANERVSDIDTLMAAAVQGATLGELMQMCCPAGDTPSRITPVNFQRPAEIFEHLRAASDAYTAKTGVHPQVFMANMGQLKQHKARTDFSQGFFEVAGFEMISNYGFHSVDEAAEAAITSRAPVVVICSTDDTYPDIVPPLTQKIKSANPETVVVLAGYPKDYIETFKQAGINEFIHLRANAYDILSRIMKTLGIKM